MGGANNIKYYDLLDYWKSYIGPKCKYNIFQTRVNRYGYQKEIAILPKLPSNNKTKYFFDKNGRQCTRCKIYKVYSEFNKSKSGINYRMNKCRICSIKDKIEYRQRTARQKDDEYRIKTRKLIIGKYIEIPKEIEKDLLNLGAIQKREVIKYKKMYGYQLKSNITGYYRWVDTGDNGNSIKYLYI